MPLKSPCDADKKVQWIGLGTGGGAKVYKKPCTCCAIRSKNLSTPNSTLCSRWCLHWQHEGKLTDYPNWQCFHEDMITPENIAELQEQSTDHLQQELAGLTARFETSWACSLIDIRQDHWPEIHKPIGNETQSQYSTTLNKPMIVREMLSWQEL
jgi:hypothetical protein